MRRFATLTLSIAWVFVGQLSQAEEPQNRSELVKRLLQRFDKNADGKLDAEERAAAQKATQALRGGQDRKKGANGDNRERVLRRFDANKNGRLDPEELAELRKQFGRRGRSQTKKGNDNPKARNLQLMQRFDANRNGRLDPPEIARIREAYPQFGKRDRPGQPGKSPDARKTRKRPETDQRKKGNDNPMARNLQLMQRFDTNKNGRLDPDELARIRQLRDRGGNRGGFRGGQAVPPRKNRVDQSALLDKFDANQNGVLDGDERRKALAAMEKK